jgi:hypothetical protein
MSYVSQNLQETLLVRGHYSWFTSETCKANVSLHKQKCFIILRQFFCKSCPVMISLRKSIDVEFEKILAAKSILLFNMILIHGFQITNVQIVVQQYTVAIQCSSVLSLLCGIHSYRVFIIQYCTVYNTRRYMFDAPQHLHGIYEYLFLCCY